MKGHLSISVDFMERYRRKEALNTYALKHVLERHSGSFTLLCSFDALVNERLHLIEVFPTEHFTLFFL